MSDIMVTGEELRTLEFQAEGDISLSLFAIALREGWCVFPQGARVLEVGCAEADWQTPMLAVRPDLRITGVDWRACERPGQFVRGDILALQDPEVGMPPFDAIVAISSIEHIGLGAYDADPSDWDGDLQAMAKCYRWLKPGGWMYLDVPYSADTFSMHTSYRRYDQWAIAHRLAVAFRIEQSAICQIEHPDSPYMAMLLRKA